MSQKEESASEKIERLRGMVEWFYGEEFELARAMGKYREAVRLAREIEKGLMEMRNEIEVIGASFAEDL